MSLTNDQKSAIDSDYGNTLIIACPGSGKTRILIAKLVKCLSDVRGTPRRIACITYTNAAVHEIEHRLRLSIDYEGGKYCNVSTIHSFCLSAILRPFAWKLREYPGGFEILPSDSDVYNSIVQEVSERHGFGSNNIEAFEHLNRDVDGTPICGDNMTTEMAEEFWSILRSKQLMDFVNIVYYAFKLLQNEESVRKTIAARYKWFLVDESVSFPFK